MDCSKDYVAYMRKERLFVKKDIAKSLKEQNFGIEELTITDDGYVVDIVPTPKDLEGMPFKELCEKVDNLDFKNYRIVDLSFSKSKVTLVLVPNTEDAINRFVWNYAICYFPFSDESEALSITIGVLEHMLEPLGKESRELLEKFIKDLIH